LETRPSGHTKKALISQQAHKIMNGQYRKDIYPGLEVAIILKKDQRSGKKTYGIVKDLLTSAAYHSRGIKVRLEDGQIGRVVETDVVGDED
jgi:uncharacterized repeat protein (TIGR03833 family)